MPRGRKAPKDCPAEPVSVMSMVPSGRPGAAVPPGDLGAEHRADGAVDVAHRRRRCAPAGRRSSASAARAISSLSSAFSSPWSCAVDPAARRALGQVGHVQDRREVEPAGLPVLDRARGVERLGVADRLVEAAEAERGQVLAHLLGDVGEERLDELRLAGELLAQLGVLGRDADRAGVEVADAHHDAAADDQRRGGEAVLLGAEQRGDDDVATGLELAVGLHDDPVAQAVEQQRLLRLGQAELPRRAGVLERRQRRRAGAAVVAGDEHDVGVRLAHARRRPCRRRPRRRA